MKKVRDIMTGSPVTLEERMSLRDAIETLERARASGAPVVAGSKVVGVASRTDILGFMADSAAIPRRGSRFVEFGRAAGSAGDPADEADPAAYYSDRWEEPESELWGEVAGDESGQLSPLDQHSVADVMTRSVVSVDPEASIQEAARRMVEMRIHRLLVMGGDDLVGVVSTMDVVRAVAEGGGE
jgi:CBS domain-containing protein